jgi:23S rRNA pseudouridine2605 synthase
MAQERVQKILARAGIASRRAAEGLIVASRVRINGRIVTELGVKADPRRDRIEVDGRRVVAEKPVYYLLNKPRAAVTTLDDPEGRETIAAFLKNIPERVYPVGRLDYHTSGALLITNDGDMTQALLHPRRKVPKTYVAKLKGDLDTAELDALRGGVTLDNGERTGKAELFVLRHERGNTWLQITITEGKNRQIHRMAESIGRRVLRLSRLSFAGLTTEGLRPGSHRSLTAREINRLKRDFLNPARRSNAGKAKAEATGTGAVKPTSARRGRKPAASPSGGPARPGRTKAGRSRKARTGSGKAKKKRASS